MSFFKEDDVWDTRDTSHVGDCVNSFTKDGADVTVKGVSPVYKDVVVVEKSEILEEGVHVRYVGNPAVIDVDGVDIEVVNIVTVIWDISYKTVLVVISLKVWD